jgi:hypothetical protein
VSLERPEPVPQEWVRQDLDPRDLDENGGVTDELQVEPRAIHGRVSRA